MVDWHEWNWRKSHVIENAAGAGTNYHVRINVHRGTGAEGDYEEDVYLNSSRCREDFGDIRFTGNDGIAQLPYWMESNNGTDAVFWVRVADNLTSDNSTMYIYYNNPDATTTSNGHNTFVYFDDFTGTTISEQLTIVENDDDYAELEFDAANDVLVGKRKAHSGTWKVALAHFPKLPSSGYAIRSKCKRVVGGAEGNTVYTVSFLDNATVFLPDNHVGERSYCKNDSTDDRMGYMFRKNGNGPGIFPGIDRSLNTWQIIESRWDNEYVEVLLDETSVGSTTNTDYIPTGNLYPAIGIACGSDYAPEPNTKYFDWVAVRNCIEDPPAHGDWGSAEEKP